MGQQTGIRARDGQGLCFEGGGTGGEKLSDKRQEETKHKQQGLQGNGKGETVEKRKCPLSEGAGKAGKAPRRHSVGREWSGAGQEEGP